MSDERTESAIQRVKIAADIAVSRDEEDCIVLVTDVDELVADWERRGKELDQRVAWELYREDCRREDEECYFHSAVQAQEFLDRGSDVASLNGEARRWVETGTGLVPRDRPLVLEPPTFPDPASHD